MIAMGYTGSRFKIESMKDVDRALEFYGECVDKKRLKIKIGGILTVTFLGSDKNHQQETL